MNCKICNKKVQKFLEHHELCWLHVTPDKDPKDCRRAVLFGEFNADATEDRREAFNAIMDYVESLEAKGRDQ